MKIQEHFINGEVVHMKKDPLGWRVVRPIKNNDGTINWKNLIAGGSWIKLIAILVFVAICIGAILEVAELMNAANQCLNQTIINPIDNSPFWIPGLKV